MFVPTYSCICVMNSAPSRVEIDFPRLITITLHQGPGQENRRRDSGLSQGQGQDPRSRARRKHRNYYVAYGTKCSAFTFYNQFVRAYKPARCSSALCLPDDCVSKSD